MAVKLGAKRAELVQLVRKKFVPQSRVGSFRKERTQFTPLDPELMFCCTSLCLVHMDPFRYGFKLDAKCSELVQLMKKFMPRSRVGICRNERSRSSPLDPKLTFCCVFVLFGCILATNAPDPPSWTLN